MPRCLHRSIVEPTAELIDPDTLDLERLGVSRSGLSEIEALTASLTETIL
jgi:hypothetical protein